MSKVSFFSYNFPWFIRFASEIQWNAMWCLLQWHTTHTHTHLFAPLIRSLPCAPRMKLILQYMFGWGRFLGTNINTLLMRSPAYAPSTLMHNSLTMLDARVRVDAAFSKWSYFYWSISVCLFSFFGKSPCFHEIRPSTRNYSVWERIERDREWEWERDWRAREGERAEKIFAICQSGNNKMREIRLNNFIHFPLDSGHWTCTAVRILKRTVNHISIVLVNLIGPYHVQLVLSTSHLCQFCARLKWNSIPLSRLFDTTAHTHTVCTRINDDTLCGYEVHTTIGWRKEETGIGWIINNCRCLV